MKDLLKSDFYRFYNNKVFVILPIFSVVYTALFVGIIKLVDVGSTMLQGNVIGNKDVFGFIPTASNAANAVLAMSVVFSIFLMIFGAWFISSEFTQGTLRNGIIIGKTRLQIYFSKMIVMVASFSICIFVSFVVFFIAFMFFFGFGSGAQFFFRTAKCLLLTLLLNLHYFGFACMFSFLIRSMQAAMTTGVLFVAAESIFMSIGQIFDKLQGVSRTMPAYYLTRINFELTNTTYLLQGIASNVVFFALATLAGCYFFMRSDVN
ncbi:MAG: hypothetical protein Ta2A_06520 [Treponemataceae bacterium]|nr:MAG: hypothetical protein Ta2A_06520 [Treponemataceae bacterium]